jgi:hypothetical protein
MAGGALAPIQDRFSRTQRQARFDNPEAPGGTHRFARQQASNNVERFLKS